MQAQTHTAVPSRVSATATASAPARSPYLDAVDDVVNEVHGYIDGQLMTNERVEQLCRGMKNKVMAKAKEELRKQGYYLRYTRAKGMIGYRLMTAADLKSAMIDRRTRAHTIVADARLMGRYAKRGLTNPDEIDDVNAEDMALAVAQYPLSKAGYTGIRSDIQNPHKARTNILEAMKSMGF